MDDYLSNPKCDKWNDPLSLYRVTVIYKWCHVPSGKTGIREIKVKSFAYAQQLVEHWNSPFFGGIWNYTLLDQI